MSRENVNACPILKQNILDVDISDADTHTVDTIRSIILLRLASLPMAMYTGLNTETMLNIFMRASGLPEVTREEDRNVIRNGLAECNEQAIFSVHPRLRCLFARNRSILLVCLPSIIHSFENVAVDQVVHYTNAVLMACGYKLLSLKEEYAVREDHFLRRTGNRRSNNSLSFKFCCIPQ